jgi:WD40 repeat protein
MRAAITFVLIMLAAAGAAAQAVDQDGLYRDPFLVVDPGMHTGLVVRLNSDSAGRFLVTGSFDKTVRVWSVEDGRLQRTIRIPAGPGGLGQIYAVAMSPNGGTIAAGGWTGSASKNNIYLFERATGREIGRIGRSRNRPDRQTAGSHQTSGIFAGRQCARGGDGGDERSPPVRYTVLARDSGGQRLRKR